MQMVKTQIAAAEVVKGGWTVVDVRSDSEFAAEHIAGALHIPLEKVESCVPMLERVAKVALLCKGGTRACLAQERLAAHGVETVVIDGGIEGWRRTGLGTVTVTRTRWSLERQVRLGAGLLVLGGTLAALAWGRGWLGLTGFVGAGLTFAGLTDICLMGRLLARAPWNRVRSCG